MNAKVALLGTIVAIMVSNVSMQRPDVDLEALPFAPRQYVAYRSPSAIHSTSSSQ